MLINHKIVTNGEIVRGQKGVIPQIGEFFTGIHLSSKLDSRVFR